MVQLFHMKAPKPTSFAQVHWSYPLHISTFVTWAVLHHIFNLLQILMNSHWTSENETSQKRHFSWSCSNKRQNSIFPERRVEGRFLGAVSLSSMTSLAWFKLLNLNLLDLTCLTWTCLTKTFLISLSWLDLGKLLTWLAKPTCFTWLAKLTCLTDLFNWLAWLTCFTDLLYWLSLLDLLNWLALLTCFTDFLYWLALLTFFTWLALLKNFT